MRQNSFSIVLCAALSLPTLAHSASPMQPGLWEVRMQSGEMKNMPKMSPQQIAQMRKMGIEIPDNRNGMIIKVCYTKAMLDRDEVPGQEGGDCKTGKMSRNGNRFSAEIVCSGKDMKGSGTVKGTYSDKHFYSENHFRGTSNGHPINQTSQVNGQWLGADCGNVKPIAN